MAPRTSDQFEEMRVERKASIEQAALIVFARDGFHAASVSKIAKEAGVSKGLMYNYFESKEELLSSLLSEVIDEAIKKMDVPQDRDLTGIDIERFINLSFEIVLENPEKWKLFMGVFMQRDVMELMKDQMTEMMESFMGPFLKYFENNGFEDPMAAMALFHTVLDGAQMKVLYSPPGMYPIEGVKKMIIKQFVR